MTNYYVDDAEWCVLVNGHISERLLADLKKDFWEFSWMIGWIHIEPYLRYINEPPRNREWRLHKRGLSSDEAWSWYKTTEARQIFVEILDTYGINPEKKKQKHGKINRFDILSRDNFRCCLCGRGSNDGAVLEVDHKHPKSKGGKDDINNLWTLCLDCNRSKSDKLIEGIANV